MKILSIVGARPQFVKAGPIVRALAGHTSVLVHTGQHYDPKLSDVFFAELELPAPDFHLGVGSGGHGEQTGAMLARLEPVLIETTPDWVMVFGDTNSTLAGALAASKLRIPVAHVEAGLRSFNRAMPEEINRLVADHVSDLLLCPGETAVGNLAAEGIVRGVHDVGDVMADALAQAVSRADDSVVLERLGLTAGQFVLATVHRAENTDDVVRLREIVASLDAIGETVVFPVHPRTAKTLRAAALKPAAHVRVIDPVGYLDMVRLEQSARRILTDSGGVQKEAYWLGVPCVTLRQETEWPETVRAGWNILAGADRATIARAVSAPAPAHGRPVLYGDGHAAARIVSLLEEGHPWN